MRWRLECQHCQKAKCLGYGMCFACDESECHYEPFINTASTTSMPIYQTNTINTVCGSCPYCVNAQFTKAEKCYGFYANNYTHTIILTNQREDDE